MTVTLDLSGKIALVTGAGRGIGRATAIKLGAAGAKVAVNYNASEAAAQEVVEAITSDGGEAKAVKADVSKNDEVEAMINGLVKEWSRVDILVNNAGITRDNLMMRMSQEEWDAVMDTNLRSAYFCTRAVLRPMLRNRWGRIICLSSVVGLTGNTGQAHYAAAKAGLIGFTKSIAREVGARNITANAIAPGFIQTDITAGLPEELKANILKTIPAERYGQPEDVANAVLFLASDLAAYVTGQVLNVDGGMVMF
ncbi:MAG TPA: 3-oxoacyl-[acyl-carrier-protein] reductase [Chloroflexia bacterium]|nr:3-oxoacyl-[acyl-carrier-protein] reductase [Chloroflexia bacterium]